MPPPRPAPEAGSLPHALTFFLTCAQRETVLRALSRTHRDRATALLKRLRVKGGAR